MKQVGYRDFYPECMCDIRSCWSPEARDIQRHGVRLASDAGRRGPAGDA